MIIFDEVQECPKARQAIKTLVEDKRYDYIERGSLISIRRRSENIIIPSEETRIEMYPMDYEEFRRALGDEATVPLLRQFCEKFSDWVSERFLVYTKDLRKDGATTLLPVMMTMFL